MRALVPVLVCLLIPLGAAAQSGDATSGLGDPAEMARVMPGLARTALASYADPDRERYLASRLQLELIAGEYRAAKATIAERRALARARGDDGAPVLDAEYAIYADAKREAAESDMPFDEAYRQTFRGVFGALGDRDAHRVRTAMTFPAADADDVRAAVARFKGKAALEPRDVAAIAAVYGPYEVAADTKGLTGPLLRSDAERRYVIRDDVLIATPNGGQISAVVVRKRGVTARQPAALVFTIYADPVDYVRRMQYAASRGYVGVAAFTRGKARSPNRIVPYEYDGRDADAVIEWIARQPWSNGKVGMYGGSYNGFTQWAALKHPPAALKTIVPYVANNPGDGLPMENNVFLLVNYPWAFYVTGNKFTDDAAYADPRRRNVAALWYASGRRYRDVDKVDGKPNPWYRRWLAHPSYDAFWQGMLPYKDEFARITIPVLTFTGWYDDGQNSALNFVRDHYAFNPRAEHYVVVGPWDHLGTQGTVKPAVLRGYAIDPVAQLDTTKLTFEWFDYVLRGARKPTLLQDKINYEVMGANVWRHAPSLDRMSPSRLRLYLTTRRTARDAYVLSPAPPVKQPGRLVQRVDFADRKTQNNDSYPFPIVGKKPNLSNGFQLLTAPFTVPATISGRFTGTIKLEMNKRDVDVGVVLYELMPDGRLFQLSYYIGRASYAADPTKRRLLRPGVPQTLAFTDSRAVSRRVQAGSRLLLTLNVNKNSHAQINYGTGKDVSDEDIRDAAVPLQIEWLTGTSFTIPISRPDPFLAPSAPPPTTIGKAKTHKPF
jgi:uncharacterized protein